MTTERKSNKVDPARVKYGDLMAIVYYVKVKEIWGGGERLVVQDLDNGLSEIGVQGKSLVQSCLSADYYAEEEKTTKTGAAEILIGSPNRPLTVCFEEQDGSQRVLRGRLVKPEPLLGRSHVEDLDQADDKDRLRLVDHRTIKWLIVDGVKYTVKAK